MSTTELEPRVGPDDSSDARGEGPRRRLLMIVNPHATTVSAQLRKLVISALRGGFELDAIDTERRGHATELCREAAGEGFDAVVAFGGDGTANEAANGLAGTTTPLTCLPGGRANVYCRMLGIPTDVIHATERLLSLATDWRPRAVDLGRVGNRHFLFSAGVGLDASVVERVDAHPRLKARLGEYYYAWVAAATYNRRYLLHPPHLTVELGEADDPTGAGESPIAINGVTVVVQNASPYTYFGNRGVELAEGASLTSGDLAGLVLKRTGPLDIPSIAWRALSSRARVAGHPQIAALSAERLIRVRSRDDRDLPLQVDGDFIGAAHEHTFSVAPAALQILA